MEPTIGANILVLQRVLAVVDGAQIKSVVDALCSVERIFTLGKGRSGLVMDMFAMRLMQLGRTVHAIGEPTAPAIRRGDVLVIGSGSGRTEACLLAADRARSFDAVVIVVSADAHSPLAGLADLLVLLPAFTKYQVTGENNLLAGTLFEQALLFFCDCVCGQLAVKLGKTTADVMRLHANIE